MDAKLKKEALWNLVKDLCDRDSESNPENIRDSKQNILEQIDKVISSKDVKLYLDIVENFDVCCLSLSYVLHPKLTLKDYATAIASYILLN